MYSVYCAFQLSIMHALSTMADSLSIQASVQMMFQFMLPDHWPNTSEDTTLSSHMQTLTQKRLECRRVVDAIVSRNFTLITFTYLMTVEQLIF